MRRLRGTESGQSGDRRARHGARDTQHDGGALAGETPEVCLTRLAHDTFEVHRAAQLHEPQTRRTTCEHIGSQKCR